MHLSLDGVVVVDKLSGPTSHDIVQMVRRLLKTRAGHTGTLDPIATGVLVVTLGRATRLTRFLQGARKEYLAEVQLGVRTSTLDRQGTVLSRAPVPVLTVPEIELLLSRFTGEIEQTPPMFSAVKFRGKKLYEFARRHQMVDRPTRRVTIEELELLERAPERWFLRVRCSAGTYIRSLAHDLGEILGCGAHLAELRRTRSGEFDLSQAVPVTELEVRWMEGFIEKERLLAEYPRLDLSPEEARLIRHGARVTRKDSVQAHYLRLFDRNHLIAIGRPDGEQIRAVIVLESQP